ncbi:MAG: hypothetical protein J7L95_05705 [Prolixibacteraceae bacterium]|nr:hypothetical protein [Prolixibacteraceae bacterium]
MENKKLLKFLLNDLNELEELVTEKRSNTFDNLEIEFLQTRVKGAKKLLQMLFEKEGETQQEKVRTSPNETTVSEIEISSEKFEKKNKSEEVPKEEKLVLSKSDERVEEESKNEGEEVLPKIRKDDLKEKSEFTAPAEIKESELVEENTSSEREKNVKLDEEEETQESSRRLGERFSKEKSVNDLLAAEQNNVEHKLSNRPVSSIKSAIGINDRFQYIRELFEGNADLFGKTVADLDSLASIKEAVAYLQQNFKWKKNEISLKFVNLIKRRFPDG